jgi:hypothetical protein
MFNSRCHPNLACKNKWIYLHVSLLLCKVFYVTLIWLKR